VDMDCGDYAYAMDDIKMTREELAKKPKGKVGEQSIKDL
jgi:hypothetical protein